MAQKRKPDRVDVVIIGAGASGATAAKVLTERGLRVVALERGPWRKRDQQHSAPHQSANLRARHHSGQRRLV